MLSIIIASRHREEILLETLATACSIIKNKAAEIIVVNDGDIPIHLPENIAMAVRYFDNPKRGVSFARNYGVSKSIGDILFFLDDDMWLNNVVIDWIESNVAGSNAVYNINWEYPPSLSIKLTTTKIGRYLLAANYNTMWGRMHQTSPQPINGLYRTFGIGSGSLVMDKSIFYLVGQYDESLIFQGEDIDLSEKINKALIPIYAVFDTTLYHNQQDRFKLKEFLERESIGYQTQFKILNNNNELAANKEYNSSKKILYDLLLITEKYWILLLNLSPATKYFTPINNRAIGILAGLQRYKQWKKLTK